MKVPGTENVVVWINERARWAAFRRALRRGRTGRQQHGDTWELDTEQWTWVKVSAGPGGGGGGGGGSGGISPRDFATAALIGGGRICVFGGYDGQKWYDSATEGSDWSTPYD